MERDYKDSNINWVGKIPQNWNVLRNKNTFTYGKDYVGGNSSSTQLLSLTTKGIRTIKQSETSGKVPESYDTYQIVRPNNLVMCLFDLDCSAVFAGISKFNGMISPAYKVLSCKSCMIPQYANYWFIYVFEGRKFMHYSKNIRYSLTYEEFSSLKIVVPPVVEQQRIADYLDRKCTEIDRLIALQEEMIEQLTDYKQSVITEAVTKGINPDAQLVPSGIEWIGDIPKGWDIVKLSLLTTKIGSGSTPTGGASVYVNEGVKFLRSQNVYFEGLDLSDVAHITDEIDEEMKGTRVIPGDVLINITGGSIGRCYFVDNTLGRANVNQHVSIIRPYKISTHYLKYYLQSFVGQLQVSLLQNGGNREGLSAAALSNFKILLPTKDVQQSIASYLDIKCSEIDELIAMKQKKIDTLTDYKKSVIYETVTGKSNID